MSRREGTNIRARAFTFTKKKEYLKNDDCSGNQMCLNHGMTFKAIAARINKDRTTVSKEKSGSSSLRSKISTYERRQAPKEVAPCPAFVGNPYEKKAPRR